MTTIPQMPRILAWLLVALLSVQTSAASVTRAQQNPAPGAPDLDGMITSMSLADRVGQLFIFSFTGRTAAGAHAAIAQLRAGGIVLVANANTADEARALIADLQTDARNSAVVPLLVSGNHEGGPIQIVKSGVTLLDTNWSVGQLPLADAQLAACQRGVIQGRELRAMGAYMNLAPDLDVLDNPQNAVIGTRSFSGNPNVAAMLGERYIEGLQSQGVLAVGKHFPGHGSTSTDSHLGLPIVDHDRAWMDTHELVPFRSAMLANVASIMVAHISFPALDTVPGRPSSLSPPIVTDLLRHDLGYQGLIMTDDLGAMQAITANYTPEESAIEAVEAGSDMLIVVGSPDRQQRMVQAVMAAVGERISETRLNASVKRVLYAKQQAGLLGTPPGGMQPWISTCPTQ